MKSLSIHSAARDEFDEAAEYYEQRLAGLGADLRVAVEEALDRIARRPRSFSATPEGYRKCLVNGFPYTIFFQERDEYIWVAAIAHQKRRPGYWLGRSPDDG